MLRFMGSQRVRHDRATELNCRHDIKILNPTYTVVEMAGWHHRLDGCEFEQALGVRDGQGSLAC